MPASTGPPPASTWWKPDAGFSRTARCLSNSTTSSQFVCEASLPLHKREKKSQAHFGTKSAATPLPGYRAPEAPAHRSEYSWAKREAVAMKCCHLAGLQPTLIEVGCMHSRWQHAYRPRIACCPPRGIPTHRLGKLDPRLQG